MTQVLDFLQQNPLVTAALILVVLGIVLTVLKKLFKIALVLILMFLIGGGTVFHMSQREVVDKGKELLEKVGKAVNEKVKELADSTKERIMQDTTLTGKDQPGIPPRKRRPSPKDN